MYRFVLISFKYFNYSVALKENPRNTIKSFEMNCFESGDPEICGASLGVNHTIKIIFDSGKVIIVLNKKQINTDGILSFHHQASMQKPFIFGEPSSTRRAFYLN